MCETCTRNLFSVFEFAEKISLIDELFSLFQICFCDALSHSYEFLLTHTYIPGLCILRNLELACVLNILGCFEYLINNHSSTINIKYHYILALILRFFILDIFFVLKIYCLFVILYCYLLPPNIFFHNHIYEVASSESAILPNCCCSHCSNFVIQDFILPR